MRLAPGGDGVIIVAIRDRAAHGQQQDFVETESDAMRFTGIFDKREVIEKQPQTRRRTGISGSFSAREKPFRAAIVNLPRLGKHKSGARVARTTSRLPSRSRKCRRSRRKTGRSTRSYFEMTYALLAKRPGPPRESPRRSPGPRGREGLPARGLQIDRRRHAFAATGATSTLTSSSWPPWDRISPSTSSTGTTILHTVSTSGNTY